jgi:alkanesulfonate monooxygenase SsuD/methylene tetrahydromethanopterin reductase-like flavin-dependent oxidoreductase (luciferase family)
LPWSGFVEAARTAEQTGYDALLLPEIAGRDAFAALAGLAAVTSTLRLGTGVVPITARSAATTTMAAATVHELSGGRMILGLGTGPAGAGALERLRRAVVEVKAALAGEPIEEPGGGRFRLSLDPGAVPPPVWIAALGPKAMRLAGEIADGVLLNWCPPERVAFARERVRDGAEAAGRDPASVTVAVYVRACVGQEPEHALPALRAAAGRYASFPAYRRQFEQVGLGEEAEAAAAALRAGHLEGVPEALVRRVCVMGEAAEAVQRLDAYRDAGADLPIVYPVAVLDPLSSILGTLFALAPHPAVEA